MDALRSAYDTMLLNVPEPDEVQESAYDLGINLWVNVDMRDKAIDPQAFDADWSDLKTEITAVINKYTIAVVTECELVEERLP